MAVLKYWDRAVSDWSYVEGELDPALYVPLIGGSITGPFPLSIDAGSAAYDLTAGRIVADWFTTRKTGALNVGIRIGAAGIAGASRSIDFGGAVVEDIRDNNDPTAAITKAKFGYTIDVWESVPIALSANRWTAAGPLYSQPTVQRDREGHVTLAGLVKSLTNIAPEVGEVIGNVPDGYRPDVEVLLSTFCTLHSRLQVRVMVTLSGDIVYFDGPQLVAGYHVSLDGCSYHAAR